MSLLNFFRPQAGRRIRARRPSSYDPVAPASRARRAPTAALAAAGALVVVAQSGPADAQPAPSAQPPAPAPTAVAHPSGQPAPQPPGSPPPGAPGTAPGAAPSQPPAGQPYPTQPYPPQGYPPPPGGVGYPPPVQPYPPAQYPAQPYPPGQYPAQPYPQQPPPAQPAAPPAPRPETPPLVVYGWDPDVPPPEGYALDYDVNGSLIGAGVALVATGWLLAILTGVSGTTVEEREEKDKPEYERDSIDPSDWSPLYIPLAGPFVAIETLDARGWGLGLLLADGLVQAAGVVGIVLGIVDQRHKVVKLAGDVTVRPLAGPAVAGIALEGRLQ